MVIEVAALIVQNPVVMIFQSAAAHKSVEPTPHLEAGTKNPELTRVTDLPV